ncbi:hypothetical protein ABKV19_025721 [Rosa sericea]
MRELHHETMIRLLTTSMQLLLSIKDDNAWYNMDGEQGENAGKMDVYKSGILFLRKLLTALGGKRILSICFELFLGHMEATKWKKCHAGISLFAVNAGECSDEMVIRRDCLDQVTAIILMKLFKEDEVQAIQFLYHWRFDYALDAAVDHHRNPRVKDITFDWL